MTVLQFTAVAISGRAVLIDGDPGSGKSSLALALIDRGAVLVGDDGVTLGRRGERLVASPPPRTAGLLEIRNVGLVRYPAAQAVPVALLLRLDPAAPRFVEEAASVAIEGVSVPALALWPDTPMIALRAEAALERYGLA